MKHTPFPNGLESWMETNRIICKFAIDKKSSLTPQCKVSDVFTTIGEDGLIDLITEWTNEFEQRYLNMSAIAGEQQDKAEVIQEFLIKQNYI